MPAIYASAPGKIIIFGEHAVVYGRPAIAIPVTQVNAKAVITPNPLSPPGKIRVVAPDIALMADLDQLPAGHPLATSIRCVLASLKISRPPSLTLRVTSTIPLAAGLGSGAAVSVAIIRALSAFLGHPFPDDQVSELSFQVEKIHHGTPSGIDNSVITYGKPVFFARGKPIEFLEVTHPFMLVIGDTGVRSPTVEVVADVRQRWLTESNLMERLFDAAGAVALEGRQAVEGGDYPLLGQLMNRNHAILQEMNVSSLDLDRLVEASLVAGAVGAKLSGGGRGGNMIALVTPESSAKVIDAIQANGAVRTIVTTVGPRN